MTRDKWIVHKPESVLENTKQNSPGFWDTNKSPNPGQKTRPNYHHQEEMNVSTCGLSYFTRPESKSKSKKLVTLVKGNTNAPFSIATTPLLHFTLDPWSLPYNAEC